MYQVCLGLLRRPASRVVEASQHHLRRLHALIPSAFPILDTSQQHAPLGGSEPTRSRLDVQGVQLRATGVHGTWDTERGSREGARPSSRSRARARPDMQAPASGRRCILRGVGSGCCSEAVAEKWARGACPACGARRSALARLAARDERGTATVGAPERRPCALVRRLPPHLDWLPSTRDAAR